MTADRLRPLNLDDKYNQEEGQIFLNGTQALVRLPLMQHRLDQQKGLNTAGFISGYRGSPLGGFDQALWRARAHLKKHHIHFTPGVNEDLGATAVWGSQQVHLSPQATVDGVFAMWYGKGPGVDRTGDVFKHANAAGSSALGGVLALAGDDHACKSSTMPHQSEYAFMDAFMPVMHPANIQDVLDLGLYGWALSRYAGVWVGFKVISDTVDTVASVSVGRDRCHIRIPENFVFPRGGVNLRWPDNPIEQEKRLHQVKLPAAAAFIQANTLNRVVWPILENGESTKPRIGFVSVGKGYLDLRQAFEDLGIDATTAHELGISLFKVTVSWPLEPSSILDFCQGLEEVIVVEEKRPVIENQIKDILYHCPAHRRPRVIGKVGENGEPVFPTTYELNVRLIAGVVAQRLSKFSGFERLHDIFSKAIMDAQKQSNFQAKLLRLPFYCSGCPHNTSTTQLPEGSRAVAGIGCHYMATWIDHRTQTFTQMGGEGVPWIGAAPFTNEKHIFANLGDGTYFHSGILAIRAAVAANVNLTYKILYNDAVAMTGGQHIDGTLSVADVTYQLQAEGVKHIAVVSDDIQKYKNQPQDFARGTTVHHRDQLMQVQEKFKEIPGVSAIVYDQTCAAEKRRRRKRKLMEDPNRRIFINEAVCEGCGDCGKKSNCLSVVPIETEWGRKRGIDQSSCNKDFSCVNGFCPSFVSVIGGQLHQPKAADTPVDLFAQLPEPMAHPLTDRAYNIFITGVGGTGVITIGSLLGMAAHLEQKGCSVVDMAGLAQKGGAVVSHVKLAEDMAFIHATRVAEESADLLLGFDLVVSSGAEALGKVKPGHTYAVMNSDQSITSHFTQNPDYVFPAAGMRDDIIAAVGLERSSFIDATKIAKTLMGDSIMANLFLVGYALQKGLIPLSRRAIEAAIRLNNVAVEANITAFNWGRLASVDRTTIDAFMALESGDQSENKPSASLDEKIQRRQLFLTDYQDEDYAQRYLDLVTRVREHDQQVRGEGPLGITDTVAQTYFRLLAYKDEYEVARLYTNGQFMKRLRQQFDGDFKLIFHLAPPLISKRDPRTKELKKRAFGPWVFKIFKVLAKLKVLRGTFLDIFGYTAERQMERQLIVDFEKLVDLVLPHINEKNYENIEKLMQLPQMIRGFGHVKEKNFHEVKAKINEFLTDLSH